MEHRDKTRGRMKGEKLVEWNKSMQTGRRMYFLLACLLVLCIVMQFLFAGMAIFMDSGNWLHHRMLVHVFGFTFPNFMLLLAWMGSMPHLAYWQVFGMMAGVFFMYFTANIRWNLPWVSTLHPVLGLLLFLLSWFIVLTSWKVMFAAKNQQRSD